MSKSKWMQNIAEHTANMQAVRPSEVALDPATDVQAAERPRTGPGYVTNLIKYKHLADDQAVEITQLKEQVAELTAKAQKYDEFKKHVEQLDAKPIALDLLSPNPWQPRRRFLQPSLEKLAESIKQIGLLQNIVVRPHPEKPGEYQIILGERRYRAVKILGWTEIPAKVIEATDAQTRLWALSETLV